MKMPPLPLGGFGTFFDAHVGAIVPYYASQVNYDFMAKPKYSLVTSESQLITHFVKPISLEN